MDGFQVIYSITTFLDRGGVVLYGIAFTALLLWFLIIERLMYIRFRADQDMELCQTIWKKNLHNGEAVKIRHSLQNAFEHKLRFTLPLIQTLVRITPLLGLFGTVYGMIEIFDVIAQLGTGDARAMADGISMATLPTMTGMAVAIVGLFMLRYVETSSNRKLTQLNDDLKEVHRVGILERQQA
jgi:biopolymer transport protein ExbB